MPTATAGGGGIYVLATYNETTKTISYSTSSSNNGGHYVPYPSSQAGGGTKTITFTADFTETFGPGTGDILLRKTGLTPRVS